MGHPGKQWGGASLSLADGYGLECMVGATAYVKVVGCGCQGGFNCDRGCGWEGDIGAVGSLRGGSEWKSGAILGDGAATGRDALPFDGIAGVS